MVYYIWYRPLWKYIYKSYYFKSHYNNLNILSPGYFFTASTPYSSWFDKLQSVDNGRLYKMYNPGVKRGFASLNLYKLRMPHRWCGAFLWNYSIVHIEIFPERLIEQVIDGLKGEKYYANSIQANQKSTVNKAGIRKHNPVHTLQYIYLKTERIFIPFNAYPGTPVTKQHLDIPLLSPTQMTN